MQGRYRFTQNRRETEDGFILKQIEGINPNTSILEVGGWIESEDNLDMNSAAWVEGDAQVYNGAKVTGKARIFGRAVVRGPKTIIDNDAKVYDDAVVSNGAKILERACVFGNARVIGATIKGDECVGGDEERKVIKL